MHAAVLGSYQVFGDVFLVISKRFSTKTFHSFHGITHPSAAMGLLVRGGNSTIECLRLIRMRRFFHNNGLSIVFATLFFLFWVAQSVVGWWQYNDEQELHRSMRVPFSSYLFTGHFIEATAENWESEFLQMFAYVLLTAFLYQKGSAESNSPDEENDARATTSKDLQPFWVRRGGWRLKVYEHSLSLAFFSMFLITFVVHGLGGASRYIQEQVQHGLQPISRLEYFKTSHFWFESLQNWQSEFLAVLSMIVLSIWLREKDSPESKDVEAPHSRTGS